MQDLLFLSRESNFIDDVQFMVLFDLFETKNPDFPYEDYAKFALDEMTGSECLAEFRFPENRHSFTCRGSPNSTNNTMRSRFYL